MPTGDTATNFAKLAPDEIALNRGGRSKDAKAEAKAAIRFAVAVVERRGHVADADIEIMRRAGYDDRRDRGAGRR